LSPRTLQDGMHKASAQRKPTNLEKRVKLCCRTGCKPGWNRMRVKAQAGKSQNSPAAKGKRSRPSGGFGSDWNGLRLRPHAGKHERKPDAGASAGDKSRIRRVVARPCAPGLDIGRQACPGKRIRQLAAGSAMNGRPRVGESGVGSNAGPICIGRNRPAWQRLRPRHFPLCYGRLNAAAPASPAHVPAACSQCGGPAPARIRPASLGPKRQQVASADCPPALSSPQFRHGWRARCILRATGRRTDLPSPRGSIMGLIRCVLVHFHTCLPRAPCADWCWQLARRACRFRASAPRQGRMPVLLKAPLKGLCRSWRSRCSRPPSPSPRQRARYRAAALLITPPSSKAARRQAANATGRANTPLRTVRCPSAARCA
jgi:hypothetical protein